MHDSTTMIWHPSSGTQGMLTSCVVAYVFACRRMLLTVAVRKWALPRPQQSGLGRSCCQQHCTAPYSLMQVADVLLLAMIMYCW
jgi:hypothetical protein